MAPHPSESLPTAERVQSLEAELAGSRAEAEALRRRVAALEAELALLRPVAPAGGGSPPRLLRDLEAMRPIFAHLSDGILVADPLGRPPEWNPAARAMHGYPPHEALALSLADLHQRFRLFDYRTHRPLPFEEWPLNRALRGEVARHRLCRVERTDSALSRVICYSAAPVFDDEGRVVLAVVTTRDETERLAVEGELDARTRELAALLDALPHPVWITHDPQARQVLANRAGQQLLGLPPEESFAVVFDERMDRRSCRLWQNGRPVEGAQGPLARAAREGRPTPPEEFEIRLPGRSQRYVYGSAVPLVDDLGAVRGAVAAFADITDRKQALGALAASEARERERAAELTALLDALPVAVCVAHDPQCRAISGNPLAYRLISALPGLRAGAAAGPLPPELAPLARACRGERVSETTLELLDAAGVRRTLAGNAVPLRDEAGAIRGAVAAFVDTTARCDAERRLLEAAKRLAARSRELLRANTELEQFAYAVSHDLRAPLRGIHMLAGWLEEQLAGRINPEQQEKFQLLRTRVRRLDQLIQGLLHYSRVGQGGSPEPVPLPALLAEVIDLLAVPAGMRVTIAAGLPEVSVDRTQLAQVLQNLIGNAIQHHDRADGQVWVAARLAEGWIEFEVSDDGPGIPEAQRERVFQIFQTLAPKSERDSSGIGLALVRKLVLAQGGTLALGPNEPRGCRFRFSWPGEPC